MTDPQKPYEIEPTDAAATPAKPPEALPKGRIDAPELLAGFDKDADFDKDPEVDRVILGKPVDAAPPAPVPESKEEFVTPGLGGPKVWAIVGGVLLLLSLIASGMQPAGSGQLRLVRVMLTLYGTLLHTGTGVVALFVAATLLRKRLGKFELAAARMLTAVGAFSLLMSMQLTLFGVDWLDRLVMLVVAAGVYIVLIATLFNVWQKHPLGYIVGSHFFLWLIVAVGMLMSQWESQMPKPAKPQTPQPAPAVVPAPSK